MLSIGMLGILSKLGDRYGCTPLNTALTLFGGSTVFMGLYVCLVQKSTLLPPAVVSGTAIFFGALAILAFWVFLYGLQFGKITTSWIFMNLSAIVPAALSVLIYHEAVTLAKALVLALVVASIVLLWKDKQQESAQVYTRGRSPRARKREDLDHSHVGRFPVERHLPVWSSRSGRAGTRSTIYRRSILSIGIWQALALACSD